MTLVCSSHSVGSAIALILFLAAVSGWTDTNPDAQQQEASMRSQIESLIAAGNYEQASDLLYVLIRQETAQQDLDQYTADFLDYVKYKVLMANQFFNEDREGLYRSSMNDARQVVTEVLSNRTMRHLGVRETDPPGMSTLFEEVRREIFGSLTISDVEPGDAVVQLAIVGQDTRSESLPVLPPDVLEGTTFVWRHLLAGTYRITCTRDGHKDLTEDVSLSADQNVTTSLVLHKERGLGFWLLGGGAVVGVGAVIAWLLIDDETPAEPQPLSGPPLPPPVPTN